ncbi:hypothetical protein EXIGLDRAFT_828507 [Exidia glandulosa HHB12029]|uniref:F-box domain-containing protein n=1 Tax=Exidia glandulosa HHB12029 TaxID=1314781 RepID=A0A165QID2_EXIGL|nr:hypothetical protein EXIGLDRAFT_828507 [Exidia glandulosa HHB12029]
MFSQRGAPASRLPVELLCLAWSHLSFEDRLAVSHVSTTWRSIAVSCPALWTDIRVWSRCTDGSGLNAVDNAAAAAQCFSRSKALPCSVIVWLHGEITNPLFRSVMLYLFATNSGRVQHIEVNAACARILDSWQATVFLNLPLLPALRSYGIYSIPPQDDNDPLTFWNNEDWNILPFAPDTVLGPRYPSLCEVALQFEFVECVSPSLPRVKRLECKLDGIDALLSILHAFSGLSVLEISISDSWAVSEDPEDDVPLITSDTLPALRSIHVVNDACDFGGFFHPRSLNHAYPKEYLVEYESWPCGSMDREDVMALFADVHTATRIVFTYRHRRVSLSVRDGRDFRRTIRFPLDCAWNAQGSIDLRQCFNELSTDTLKFIAVDAELWRWFRRFLGRIPNLERLVIFVGKSGLPEMSPIYDNQAHIRGGPVVFPLPNLSSLRLVELRAMRRTRVAVTVDKVLALLETIPGRPTVLKLTRIKMHHIAAKLLKIYVGKVVFA